MARILAVFVSVLIHKGEIVVAVFAEVVTLAAWTKNRIGKSSIRQHRPGFAPGAGRHATLARGHAYKRYGTVSLLAGIDLLSGEVLCLVRDRHRSVLLGPSYRASLSEGHIGVP